MKWISIMLFGLCLHSKAQILFEIPIALPEEWVSLYDYTEILVDQKGCLELNDVLYSDQWGLNCTQQEYDDEFIHWARLELKANRASEYLLNLPQRIKNIECFIIRNNEIEKQITGQYSSPHTKPFIYLDRNFVLVSTSENETVSLVIRMDPHRKYSMSRGIDIRIQAFHEFKGIVTGIEKRDRFFTGIFITMMLFNFLFYINVRERTYLLYGSFIFFAILALGLRLDSFRILPAYFIYDLFSEVWSYSAIICLFLFTTYHLDVKRNSKLATWICYGTISFFAFIILLMLVDFLFFPDLKTIRSFTMNGFPYFLIIAAASLLIVGLAFLIKRLADRFFAAGMVIMALPLIVFAINFFPLYIPFSIATVMFYSALCVQMVLLSLSISAKLKKTQQERSMAVEEKLEIQENINLQLEEKVTERTAQLEHRNKENELLLGEIHHRVKNNLQVISSLLKLQSRQLEEGHAKSAVLEGRDRVKAMALIHQRLYQQDQFSTIQMADYVQNLVENLAKSYGYSEKDFELELIIPEIQLDVDTAVPLGLIINELISNSFKHAFRKGRSNKLKVVLEQIEFLSLDICDNGPGLPVGFRLENASSFGLQLIEALTEELDGTLTFSNSEGTEVNVIFRDFKQIHAPD